MADMNEVLRQAQELQRSLADAQTELAATEVTGSAGGGSVTVTATADGAVRAVHIDPDAVDPDDVGMLEDLVLAAISDVLRRGQELQAERMGGLTDGMNLPPGLV